MRSSGILLHITSLPSGCGIGTLEQADDFIRFLVESGQEYWQILPVTPTDNVNSPYSGSSAFAGNTMLIDCNELYRKGLISQSTFMASRTARGSDFDFARKHKEIMLREAYDNFLMREHNKDFAKFVDDNESWLSNYALYNVFKRNFDNKPWYEWPEEYRDGKVCDTRDYDDLGYEIDFEAFCQYVFFTQWQQLRDKLKQHNIKLIGDVPMYVAYDSADVWGNREQFKLTKDGKPSVVAGVPPDYFSADGQLWGNPIYNWKEMRNDNYRWWLNRIKMCEKMFDVLRIDHFRAFDSYCAIPYGDKNARRGRWVRGEGYKFVKKLVDSTSLTIVAEDLGVIPESVHKLRNKLDLAGMKVMQFGFDGNPKNPFLPDNYEEHTVAYLGTHDNDTTESWYANLDGNGKYTVQNLLKLDGDDNISHRLIEKLAYSNAELVIYTMQDVAMRGGEARMNAPGTVGCWTFMADKADFSGANAKWLKNLTDNCGRCNTTKEMQ